jgi:hypothetical protein
MKMPQITKRDIKCFLFGMLAMLLLTLVFNWEDSKAGFQEGFKDAIKDFKQ